MIQPSPPSPLLPYTTLFRSSVRDEEITDVEFVLTTTAIAMDELVVTGTPGAVSKRTLGNAITTINASEIDRKSTRLNSSHSQNSYAVFCLKKKTHRNRLSCC